MSKRIADHYLTDQNCEEKDDPLEPGSWKEHIASKDVIAGRKVIKARRRTGTLIPENINDSINQPTVRKDLGFANPFANVPNLFGKPTVKPKSDTPAAPSIAPSLAPPVYPSSVPLAPALPTTMNKPTDKPPRPEFTEDEAKEYKSRHEKFTLKITNMNKAFSKHIQFQLADSYSVNLSPSFEEYKLYMNKLYKDMGKDKDGELSLDYVRSLRAYRVDADKAVSLLEDMKRYRDRQTATTAYSKQLTQFRCDSSKCDEYAEAVRRSNDCAPAPSSRDSNALFSTQPFSGDHAPTPATTTAKPSSTPETAAKPLFGASLPLKSPSFTSGIPTFNGADKPKPAVAGFGDKPKPLFSSAIPKFSVGDKPTFGVTSTAIPKFNADKPKPLFNAGLTTLPTFNPSSAAKSIFGAAVPSPKSGTSDPAKPVFNVTSPVAFNPSSKSPADTSRPIFGGGGSRASDFEATKSVFGPSGGFKFGESLKSTPPAADDSGPAPFTFAAKPLESSGFTFGFSAKGGAVASTFGKPGMSTRPEPEDKDKYTPPVTEVKEIIEEEAFYTVKCKLFYKKGDKYADRGVGNLHLKNSADNKTILLIRAATNLGNILLNIKVNKDMPISRSGKNNLSIYCVANPPIDTESKEPISFLIRVKNAQIADLLKDKLEEAKSSA